MPAPYSTELKKAAVEAVERGDGTLDEVAEQFAIGKRTLSTWLAQLRERGTLEPAPRGGGNFSQVDAQRLRELVAASPDATTDELTRAYNTRLAPRRRVHRSRFLRALKREEFVLKKRRSRPAEQDKPEVQAKRQQFERWMKRANAAQLFFLDEPAANTKMGRSHAWVRRGHTLVDPRPMNWGKSLTMIGAIRFCGRVCLGTLWGAANARSFRRWFVRKLLPKLRLDDTVIMDNAKAHNLPSRDGPGHLVSAHGRWV